MTALIPQTEHADFTINSSDPIVANLAPYTISGTLARMTTPEPATSVSLFARIPGSSSFREVATTITDSGGADSFANLTSSTNQLYQVRATFGPARDGSAVRFKALQDAFNMTASSSTAAWAHHVLRQRLAGQVRARDLPAEARSERRLAHGASPHVAAGSTFSFDWTFGAAGSKRSRARITGGTANVGAASGRSPQASPSR